MSGVATRTSWKNSAMPDRRGALTLDLRFTAEEYAKLAAGLIPVEMEDKWFIFLEGPWLYLHRSWTGFCVYQVCLEPDGTDHRMAEVIVNRDPTQHVGSDDEQDVLVLSILLHGRSGRDAGPLLDRYRAGLRDRFGRPG